MFIDGRQRIDSIGETPPTLFESKADLISAFITSEQRPIPTFSEQINFLLHGGIQNGKVYTLLAKAGGGKTTLALQLAEDMAESGEALAIYVSMEMSGEELATKALSRYGKFDSGKIEGRKEGYADSMMQTMNSSEYETMSKRLVILQGQTHWTVGLIRGLVDRIRRCHATDGQLPRTVLFIDPFQRLSSGDPGIDRELTNKINKIVSDFKHLARSMNIPVFLLSDTTKDSAQKQERGEDMGQTGIAYSYFATHITDVQMEIATGEKVFEKLDRPLFSDEGFNPENYSLGIDENKKTAKQLCVTRATIFFSKNRGGRENAHIGLIYRKALHEFIEPDAARDLKYHELPDDDPQLPF